MAEPSPQAQAVMIAATNGNINVVNDPVYKQCIAAALRAAADQVVPENKPDAPYEFCCDYTQLRTQDTIRHRFLAIATELENQ